MTITLKNVPPALHQVLTRQAKKNKRSLNQDLIKYLEEKAEAEKRRKAFVELARHRNKLGSRRLPTGLDPVKIIRALRDGR